MKVLAETEMHMRPEDQLWALEERFWTGGRDSARATTAAGAIMIFPYPAGILQGDEIWKHQPASSGWRMVEMTGRSFSQKGQVAILAYRVQAEKPDTPIFEALCASTWLNDGGTWMRLSHQQTPVT